ncbi:MAG: phosphoribosyltransferase family protein [bacterium]|nr:phosphoribosyltransferase family protein [bacterium]
MAAEKIKEAIAYLKQEFLRDAKVLDSERGYISISSFNLRMKPQVLAAAAAVIAHEFKGDRIDIVHGIPHSGNYLATAVALALGGSVRLHASRKDQNIPTSWKDVYREEVQSFTTSSQSVTVFSGINLSFVQKGDRVLLVDDVCATGEAGYHIVSGLQKRGVQVVGLAVLFDKIFQGGVEYVSSLGVKVFSCVRVEKIGKGDTVVIKP